MLKRTPLKRKTPLQAKTPWRWKPKPKAKEEPTEGKVAASKKKRVSREPNYVADMDKVFQFYIRLRDAMPGGMTRCISCNNVKPFDQMQAGHFHSRKHFMTRWHEDNVHSECIYDNCYNGDHLHDYEIHLKKKIGMTRYNVLEIIYKQPKKWTHFEITMMIKHYGRLCLQLSASKHITISKGVMDIIKRYDRKKL
jgi:hypothetical protein